MHEHVVERQLWNVSANPGGIDGYSGGNLANVSVYPARGRFPSDSANTPLGVIHVARKWNLPS